MEKVDDCRHGHKYRKYLVGSKKDLDRTILESDALDYAIKNKFSKYFEVSSKSGENCTDIFKCAVWDLLSEDPLVLQQQLKERTKSFSLHKT